MSAKMLCGFLASLGLVACGSSSDDSNPAAGGASGTAGASTGGAGGATGGTGAAGGSGGTTGGAGGVGGATGGAAGATGGAAGATGGSGGVAGSGGGGPVSCDDFPSTVPLTAGYVASYKSAYLCFTNDGQLAGNCTLETGLSKTGCLDGSDVHLEFQQCQAGSPQCQTGSEAVYLKANAGPIWASSDAGLIVLNGGLVNIPPNVDVTAVVESTYQSGMFYTVVFNFDGANTVTIKSFEPS